MAERILAVGDLHFKSTKLSQAREMMLEIERIVREQCPDRIVILGDTLDTHEKINLHALVEATQFIQRLSQHSLVDLLIGNHDRPNNQDFLSDYHPFVGLQDHPRIQVISSVVAKPPYIWVPYVAPGKFVDALRTVLSEEELALLLKAEETQASAYRLIFAHQEFRGAQMGAIESEHGDEWPATAVPVVTGHIHDYQFLEPNVYYPGTPVQHSFAEKSKSVSLFHWDEGQLQEERIPTHVTMHRTDNINADEFDQYEAPSGYILRLKIHLTEAADARKAKQLIKRNPKYQQLLDAGVKVVFQAQPQQKVVIKRGSFRQRVETELEKDPDLQQLWFKINHEL